MNQSLWEQIPVVNCSRCGEPCKLADTANEEARLLKHATKPETSGYCLDCAVADFMQNRSHLAEMMAMNPHGKQMLLDARVQQQFAAVMQAGQADARPEEINWQRVYEHWELPFPKVRKARKRSSQ
jgi:hypothetical protein